MSEIQTLDGVDTIVARERLGRVYVLVMKETVIVTGIVINTLLSTLCD